jgi:hypothetical protein
MLDTGPLAVPAVFAHTTPVMATEAQKGSFLRQATVNASHKEDQNSQTKSGPSVI